MSNRIELTDEIKYLRTYLVELNKTILNCTDAPQAQLDEWLAFEQAAQARIVNLKQQLKDKPC